jgi:signal transduction histidine kinase
MKTRKTLIEKLKKQIFVTGVITALCSITIVISIVFIAHKHEVNSEIKRATESLNHQSLEIASQILVYSYHHIPIPNDLSRIAKKIHPQAKIGVKSVNGECILGDCSVFKNDRKQILVEQKIKVADEIIGDVAINLPHPVFDFRYLGFLVGSVLLTLIVFVFSVYWMSLKFFRIKILRPLDELGKAFSEYENNLNHENIQINNYNQSQNQYSIDFENLFQKFKKMTDRVSELTESEKNLAIHKAENELSDQVAHDIRSPLSALDMMISISNELPEDKRTLLRNAVNRIRDIANTLNQRKLKNNESQFHLSQEFSIVSHCELVYPVLDYLASEKRLQYRDLVDLQINLYQNSDCYGLFASFDVNEFKRVISNIINNSVESFNNGKGIVSIKIFKEDNFLTVEINDNGIGIPESTLIKLGTRGATFNKKGGTGLGLYHAKCSAEKWGGKLSVSSEVGIGTTVKIKLPAMNTPNWFLPKLFLHPESTLVILDDDQSIHQIWKDRLNHFESYKINLIHLTTPQDFRDFYKSIESNITDTRFLIDYEFLNHSVSGLDLIEELNIGMQSVLVTSRFEELKIRELCAPLNVKLIPKSMSGFVPIVVV